MTVTVHGMNRGMASALRHPLWRFAPSLVIVPDSVSDTDESRSERPNNTSHRQST